MITDEKLVESRFIRKTDENLKIFVFPLPEAWWSRPHEYGWAMRFAEKTDIALDAACGLCHPLKFFLLDQCREVYACDHDERILSTCEIRRDISTAFGENIASRCPDRYLSDIRYSRASILSLPYPEGKFDKIYCMSTLEHLKDVFNRYRITSAFRKLLARIPVPKDIYSTLKEFKRVLGKNGFIVITFDYPIINLEYFQYVVSKLGLSFAGRADFQLPEDPLYSKELGLYCFRAVLKHQLI